MFLAAPAGAAWTPPASLGTNDRFFTDAPRMVVGSDGAVYVGVENTWIRPPGGRFGAPRGAPPEVWANQGLASNGSTVLQTWREDDDLHIAEGPITSPFATQSILTSRSSVAAFAEVGLGPGRRRPSGRDLLHRTLVAA